MDRTTTSTRGGATWPAGLSAAALVLTAAVLVHLGMLLRPAHPSRAAGATRAAAAAHQGGAPTHSRPDAPERDDGTRLAPHLMLAACLVVVSLMAVARDPARGRARLLRRQAPGRDRGWVPTRSAHRPRGPTRVDAGVVLRV